MMRFVLSFVVVLSFATAGFVMAGDGDKPKPRRLQTRMKALEQLVANLEKQIAESNSRQLALEQTVAELKRRKPPESEATETDVVRARRFILVDAEGSTVGSWAAGERDGVFDAVRARAFVLVNKAGDSIGQWTRRDKMGGVFFEMTSPAPNGGSFRARVDDVGSASVDINGYKGISINSFPTMHRNDITIAHPQHEDSDMQLLAWGPNIPGETKLPEMTGLIIRRHKIPSVLLGVMEARNTGLAI